MKWFKGSAMFIGRLLLAILFIKAGVGKFMAFEDTQHYMEANGMTLVPFFLVVAAILEILGGLALLLGYKTRWGALLLIIVLVPATIIFHNFWNPDRAMQFQAFFNNLGILGGLFTILGCGGGVISLDNCCRKKHEHH